MHRSMNFTYCSLFAGTRALHLVSHPSRMCHLLRGRLMSMDTKELVLARKEAEKAVAGMPDDAHKLKAFEVILGKLLDDGNPPRKDPATERRKNKPEPKTAKRGTAAKSLPARILVLREDGFFKNQRSIAEILG